MSLESCIQLSSQANYLSYDTSLMSKCHYVAIGGAYKVKTATTTLLSQSESHGVYLHNRVNHEVDCAYLEIFGLNSVLYRSAMYQNTLSYTNSPVRVVHDMSHCDRHISFIIGSLLTKSPSSSGTSRILEMEEDGRCSLNESSARSTQYIPLEIPS